jgi:hypothetical protein
MGENVSETPEVIPDLSAGDELNIGDVAERTLVANWFTPSSAAPPNAARIAVPRISKGNRSIYYRRLHRRRVTAAPNRKATSSEVSGASRVTLLKMLNGIPGLRPRSMASLK